MAKVWTDVFNSVEPAQFNSLTEKTTPASADTLVIEDSAASSGKKRVQVGNLRGSEVLTAKMLDGYLERQNVQTGLTGGGAFSIDIIDGTTHYVDLAGNMGTLTIADTLSASMTDSDGAASMTLFFQTGGNTFTMDPNVVWVGGSPPTWDAAAWDVVSFFKKSASSAWVALHGGVTASV